ncbi:MAG: PQQ-binding-like beta-propeller repeat protein [Halobacteriaceae archaeon]
MRLATAVALAVVLAALGGAVAFALLGGSGGGSLAVRWTSDTAVSVEGNHHAVAAGRVANRSLVFVPRSGSHDTTECALIALDAGSGSEAWRHRVPPGDCWIHSLATLTLGDYDGDGVREVVAPTTENVVYAFDPATGAVELEHDLSAYGYSPAVVGHLLGGSRRQVAVADAKGTVYVLYPNGTAAWTDDGGSYVWAPPALADFTAGPGNELAVGFGGGYVRVYRPSGDVAWNASEPFDGSLTWMGTGDANGDGKTDVAAATTAGEVVVLDGRDGDVLWERDFGDVAAVDAFGDGDGDGRPEVYAVAGDGVLRALGAATGRVEWTTALTTGDVQMTPPPVLGDVDGDGRPELVAVTNGGAVSVVDPSSGAVLAAYERDVPVWERATVADTDGDGADEIYVVYGDGRVVKLAYTGGSAS